MRRAAERRQADRRGRRSWGSRPEATTLGTLFRGASPEVSTTRSSPAARRPLEIVEMAIARRAQPPCDFFDLLRHLVPSLSPLLPCSSHPFRYHSNPSVEFEQEASVVQTTSEYAQTRFTSLLQGVLGSRRNPLWCRRGLPSSRRGFESALDTSYQQSDFSRAPKRPRGSADRL